MPVSVVPKPGPETNSPEHEKLKAYAINPMLFAELSIVSSACFSNRPGRVAQSVGHLTRKSGVLGSIPGLATYFRFSFRFFKKGSCQLHAKVYARSTG